MKVTVTNKDIAYGCKSNESNCPIARAVNKALGIPITYGAVEVGIWDIHIMGAGSFKTSRSAKRFIQKFDSGKKVKPFTFILRDMDGA